MEALAHINFLARICGHMFIRTCTIVVIVIQIRACVLKLELLSSSQSTGSVLLNHVSWHHVHIRHSVSWLLIYID